MKRREEGAGVSFLTVFEFGVSGRGTAQSRAYSSRVLLNPTRLSWDDP